MVILPPSYETCLRFVKVWVCKNTKQYADTSNFFVNLRQPIWDGLKLLIDLDIGLFI
jgi:hypothetical protein